MPARLWSELPAWERRAELVKAHPDLTEAFLIADGRNVPELAAQIRAQESKDDQLKVVLRYFGDEGNPQQERGELMPLIWGLGEPDEDVAARMRRSPPWGRLPSLEDDGAPQKSARTRGSVRGRREKSVSVLEATRAAAIYMQDRLYFDALDDGGAYAVHKLYVEDREPQPATLSRPMVGHLLQALRERWLGWDARKGRIRISNEFRTSPGMFLIPRRKPAS